MNIENLLKWLESKEKSHSDLSDWFKNEQMKTYFNAKSQAYANVKRMVVEMKDDK